MAEQPPLRAVNGNKPPAAKINVELGVGPLTPGGFPFGALDSGRTSTLVNKPVVSVKQLTEMRRRDGQAKALFQLVTLPLRLALQTGEWIDPEEKGETEEAKFANQMWSLPPNAGGMTAPRSKLVRQALLALMDGFAAFEIVRTVPKKGPLAGKVVLKKLAYRDPNTIQFQVDKNGGYRGFRQIATMADLSPVDVMIPADKSWYFAMHDEQNPFYGVSMFESAYPHWDAKRKLYYIAHIAAQFAAVPGRLGKIPEATEATKTQIDEFRSALQNFAFNTAMIVPAGFDVTPFNSNSGYDFLKLIDHHNAQMSKSILASFFDAEQRTVLIENGANQSVDADFFLLSMTSIANDIAESMSNHLMPQFIDYNFDSGRYPVFKPGDLSDGTKDAIREMFTAVVTASILNSTPEFVRELEKKVSAQLNLDIDYDNIEKREKQSAQEQASQPDPNAAPGGPGDPGGPGGNQGGPNGGPTGGPDNGGGDVGAPFQPSSKNGGGVQGPGGGGAPRGQNAQVAASHLHDEARSIDELVLAAQDLLLQGVEPELFEPPALDIGAIDEV